VQALEGRELCSQERQAERTERIVDLQRLLKCQQGNEVHGPQSATDGARTTDEPGRGVGTPTDAQTLRDGQHDQRHDHCAGERQRDQRGALMERSHCNITLKVTVPLAPAARLPFSVHWMAPIAPASGCAVNVQLVMPAGSEPQLASVNTVYPGVAS